MSGRNTKVPSVIAAPLPVPVVADEYARCPVTDVLRLLGDKWTLLVIVLLGKRPYRYNELHRGIRGISQRMLTRTLRDRNTTASYGERCSRPCRRRSSTASPNSDNRSRPAVSRRRLGGGPPCRNRRSPAVSARNGRRRTGK